MKTTYVLLTVLILSCTTLLSQEKNTNRLIVKFDTQELQKRNQEPSQAIENLLDAPYQKKKIGKQLGNDPLYILSFKNSSDKNQSKSIFKESKLIKYVESDYMIQNNIAPKSFLKDNQQNRSMLIADDPKISNQWGLHNDGSFSPYSVEGADVKAFEAWDYTTGSEDIIVAILDSGINYSHSEFNDRIYINTPELGNNGIDDDGNGYIDDYHGWDLTNGDNQADDDHGHGTCVAGILAANGNNGFGTAGLDWNCKILPVKVLDENNNGLYLDWIEGIYYAVDMGVNVINMSLVFSSYREAFEEAVIYANDNNVTIVAAMGNTGDDFLWYPAAHPTTIAVGSSKYNDLRSNFSNYGDHIDVIAPGEDIQALSPTNSGFNGYWEGTSMATPLVSGLVTLMLSMDSTLTPEEIKNLINTYADDQVGGSQDTPGWDPYYGNGRLNAKRTLEYLNNILSVRELQNKDFVIYPNPADNELFINLAQNQNIDEYIIANIQGQIVMKNNFSYGSPIDINSLSSGVYILKLTGTDIATSKRFIKH